MTDQKQPFHYFASCFASWATSEESAEDAIHKATKHAGFTGKDVRRMQRNGAPGLYFWACRVELPSDASYKISGFAPQDVEITRAKHHYVTNLTTKDIAIWTE